MTLILYGMHGWYWNTGYEGRMNAPLFIVVGTTQCWTQYKIDTNTVNIGIKHDYSMDRYIGIDITLRTNTLVLILHNEQTQAYMYMYVSISHYGHIHMY